MNTLEAQGMGCAGCAGTCCTYEANSMMVTPVEAIDLLLYLKRESMLDQELKAKCVDSVQKYRLDSLTGNGRRSFVRRTYTCPFFHHKELGCPLPREVKPYGCLAFNAHHVELKAGAHCFSETPLLVERESADASENVHNEKLRKQLGLWWEKLPLPVALLELWEKDLSGVCPTPN